MVEPPYRPLRCDTWPRTRKRSRWKTRPGHKKTINFDAKTQESRRGTSARRAKPPPLEGLALRGEKVLGDRAEGEGRKILEQSDDHDHREQEEDEQRPVGRHRAGGGLGLLLRRERSGDREDRDGVGEPSEEHRNPGCDIVPGGVR